MSVIAGNDLDLSLSTDVGGSYFLSLATLLLLSSFAVQIMGILASGADLYRGIERTTNWSDDKSVSRIGSVLTFAGNCARPVLLNHLPVVEGRTFFWWRFCRNRHRALTTMTLVMVVT